MSDRVVLRAVGWQVYGGLLMTAGIIALFAEIGWWIFFLYDRSTVSAEWSWIVHVSAAVMLAAGLHYASAHRRRARALSAAGDRASLEGKGLRFAIGPFPVKIDYGFFIMAAMFGSMTGGLVRAAVFIVSTTIAIVAHELAHAVVARQGRHFTSIRLHLLGGTTLHVGPPLSGGREVAIAAAGPAAGLLLGGIVLLFPSARGNELVSDFVFVNAGWAVANLAPILPLDGGAILR